VLCYVLFGGVRSAAWANTFQTIIFMIMGVTAFILISNALGGPAVAIVGTRRCTRYGHDVARGLGARLAASGVTVVSGLAAGIDAAAHRGALDAAGAAPAAVVATGLDVVYPSVNRALWADVEEQGVILTEGPLGTAPEAWRFPARNRIIAALADVTVVVESHAAGGSLYTVEEALVRDRPVLAVPGSIRSPASVGTNRLLSDGAEPLCAVEDVFVALGLAGDGAAAVTGTASEGASARDLDDEQRSVLEAVGWEPTPLDRVLSVTGLTMEAASLAIERLVGDGRLDRRGAWLEQRAR
ncbi:MAG: DNA-processing protein DprA, partial [Actinomycetota bacterium]